MQENNITKVQADKNKQIITKTATDNDPNNDNE